jgi:transposase-like protein
MKRYSEADKAWLIQEWEQSGKSKWAFAKELGLPYQTFNRWTRPPAGGQGFVEVSGKLEEGTAEAGERTGCALAVERGSFRIHFPAGATARDLAVAVQALG